MENQRLRKTIHLVHTGKRFEKLMCDPTMETFKRFSEDLCTVHMRPKRLLLNRPTFCGMAVLDLAKAKMYDLFYNHLRPNLGGVDNMSLLFTDTGV